MSHKGISAYCSQRMVIRMSHCLAPSGSSLKGLWCNLSYITISNDRILFDAFVRSLFVNKKHST